MTVLLCLGAFVVGAAWGWWLPARRLRALHHTLHRDRIVNSLNRGALILPGDKPGGDPIEYTVHSEGFVTNHSQPAGSTEQWVWS